MKQWRVGTVSMGATLILFGSVLMVSQWQGKESLSILLDWWPAIFILLGIEVLVYLAMSKKADSFIKYDVFSIIFVWFLCITCVATAALAYSGLWQEIRFAVSAVERTDEIAGVSAPVPGSVKQIIVQNKNQIPVQISVAEANEVHVFGTYRYTHDGKDLFDKEKESVMTIRTVGDTMYVRINEPPVKVGLNRHYTRLEVTVVIPEGINMTFDGAYEML